MKNISIMNRTPPAVPGLSAPAVPRGCELLLTDVRGMFSLTADSRQEPPTAPERSKQDAPLLPQGWSEGRTQAPSHAEY